MNRYNMYIYTYVYVYICICMPVYIYVYPVCTGAHGGQNETLDALKMKL